VSTYVLVHGAWMGAWVWDGVAQGLRSAGATVQVLELPAHGSDEAPLSAATLATYVAKVRAAIESAHGKVILVGHSMAGMVVTQAAEDLAERIDKVVYLAAYLPQNGQTLLDLATTDAESQVGKVLKVDEQRGVVDVPVDQLGDCFVADGAPAAAAALRARYRPEPLAGFVAPVKTTEARWGSVAKVYFYTEHDRAVSYALQRRMTDGVKLDGTQVFASSHSPFLSQPDQLVAALARFAQYN
jgi:pimeloyl-ACP methyl ester carboxylesterase